jgi:hypothetical protein
MTVKKQLSKAKIPGVWVLVCRICRIPPACRTWECKLGFFCLISNVPIGIIGAAVCILLHSITDKDFFIALGTIIYAASWLMLLLGVFLTGKHLAAKIRKNLHVKVRAWRKLRKKLRQNCAITH